MKNHSVLSLKDKISENLNSDVLFRYDQAAT